MLLKYIKDILKENKKLCKIIKLMKKPKRISKSLFIMLNLIILLNKYSQLFHSLNLKRIQITYELNFERS